MKYFLGQIIGLGAFFLFLVAYHRKKKNDILSNMIISNLFNLVHYILLDAYSGFVTKIMAICRDLFILLKEKYKSLSNIFYLFVFLIIYIILGIITYDGIASLFPVVAAFIYIIPIWNGNEKVIRKVAFLSYFLWLFYNVYVFSIAGILSNVVSIISLMIAIRKN